MDSKKANISVVNNKRIQSFDIARGVCILLMVMGHVGFGVEFHKVIHTFHMPIFFFVSGYFYRPEKIVGIYEYVSHLARTLLLPYFVFALFYEILHILFTGSFSVNEFVVQLVSSNHNRLDVAGSLWFLLCLFISKVVYFIIERSVMRKWGKMWHVSALVFLISLMANCLRKIGIILPLCFDSALSCLLLIHVGYLLYRNRDKKYGKVILSTPLMLLLLLFVLFFFAEQLNADINVRRNRFGIIPLYWISCFCGIVITMNLSGWVDKSTNLIGSGLKKTLGYWGRESLIFLIFNELMIFIVSMMLRAGGIPKTTVTDSYSLQLLMVGIVMILLSLSAYFANKKPIKYLFGKY